MLSTVREGLEAAGYVTTDDAGDGRWQGRPADFGLAEDPHHHRDAVTIAPNPRGLEHGGEAWHREHERLIEGAGRVLMALGLHPFQACGWRALLKVSVT